MGFDAGPVDAGMVDAGMVDAGPVDAGPVDAGGVPPPDAGGGDAGFDAGADAGYDAGPPRCGAAACEAVDLCLRDAGTPVCVDCIADGDCPGASDVCCGGTCVADVDTACGCGAAPGAAPGIDCTALPANRRCVAGECGCFESGEAECGSDNGLYGLCTNEEEELESGGVCVAQSESQCGMVGGVLDGWGEAIPGGTCAPSIGGSRCIDPADGSTTRCGCTGEPDCRALHVVDTWPRRSADSCTDTRCACEIDTGVGPCGATVPDCTPSAGCVDLRLDTFHCGDPGNSCQLPGTGLDDGTGTCVNGGCECDQQSDCDLPENVDACLVLGVPEPRCICADFDQGGVNAACPHGLECVQGGCVFPPGSGNVYGTLGELLTAMGL